MIMLPEFVVHAHLTPRQIRKLSKELARQREQEIRARQEYETLRYNIFKVYPYSLIAADVLKDVDTKLAKITDKKARKEYLKTVEKELNRRFKGELENLTITQGQLLVKLIDRQTGKNCYSIIKELKGGFSAVVWQAVAILFSNNLKREYDPTGDDKQIEAIVQNIEGYYHYKQGKK
jgi:hypothetical protein